MFVGELGSAGDIATGLDAGSLGTGCVAGGGTSASVGRGVSLATGGLFCGVEGSGWGNKVGRELVAAGCFLRGVLFASSRFAGKLSTTSKIKNAAAPKPTSHSQVSWFLGELRAAVTSVGGPAGTLGEMAWGGGVTGGGAGGTAGGGC